MAVNLQIDQAIDSNGQSVKDENGNASPLILSANKVGIGTTAPDTILHIKTPNQQMIALDRTDDPTIEDKFFLGVGQTGGGDDVLTIDSESSGNLVAIDKTGRVGIGTAHPGKRLEVVGAIVERESADNNGTAVLIAAEADGLGSLWTNDAYDASKHTSGWRRTINLRKGNVGIGLNMQNPQERLEVDGNISVTGDIKLIGADCAENFDVEEAPSIEPGAVMVIGDEETLQQCSLAYDKRVAGVISGAGDCKPGMVLGNHQSQRERLPLALNGKVYCKVDAGYAPISVGDLLTTSPSPGYAMKANDPLQAFGAVIGKALRPLAEGKSLIPILIALQ
jgi:hypothetical protein